MSRNRAGSKLASGLLIVALLAVSSSAGGKPAKPIVYRGVTLIDGRGGAPGTDMDIVVDGERIRAVVPDAATGQSLGGAKLIDAHGLYAIPGLIDSHVHLATSPDRRYAEALLRRFVYSGVTAVRDMAGDDRLLADLARGALLGEITAPDIYYAALVAGPAFFKDPRTADATRGAVAGEVPWMRAITPATDLKLAIAEAHGTGATGIKVYADLPGELVRSITEEAHRQHLLVWAHAAVFPASPREVIDAGVDTVSHSCLLAYQASAQMPPAYHHRPPVEADKFADAVHPVMAELFDDMKRRGTILDATVYVYRAMWQVPNAQPPPYCSLALAEKITANAHRAGVAISTGTDAPGDWNDAFPSLDDELSLLVHHAGFTPAEAIAASSRIGAMTIGQSKNMGAIAPGMLANIAFLAKDPLADIGNVRSVVMTLKRGRLYRRSDYKPITKDEAQGEF